MKAFSIRLDHGPGEFLRRLAGNEPSAHRAKRGSGDQLLGGGGFTQGDESVTQQLFFDSVLDGLFEKGLDLC